MHFRSSLLALAVLALAPTPLVLASLPTPDHVVVVIMENHSYPEVIGVGTAPYINSLAASAAVFTDSHGIGHPSEPNYLWLFSGSNQGVTDDSCPHSYATANLGQELIDHALTFACYAEDLPAEGSAVCTSGKYARKHNPLPDFTNVPASASKPWTAFPADFSTLADVTWVVPNLDHDMHDGSVAQGDAWLQANIDGYVQWAATHNSLLILTWDEDDGTVANHIATLFVGPMVQPGSYSETIDHVDILRTLEDMYAVPYAGASSVATPITDAWNVCGDGNVDVGEQCGEPALSCDPDLTCQACTCVNTSLCTSGIALSHVRLSMRADPFSMKLLATAVIPKPWTGIDPAASGIRFVVDEAVGTAGVDVTIPGGAAWKVNKAGTRWTYADRTGAVGGITHVVVSDQSSKEAGRISINAIGRVGTATLPAIADGRVAVVFGDTVECGGGSFSGLGLACFGDTTRFHCR